MSARKRARTAGSAPSRAALDQPTTQAAGWHAIPPELLQLATAYCLGTPAFPFVQLLCRFSAVCVTWHDMVCRADGGAGRADFWAMVGTGSVVRSYGGREVVVAGRSFPTAVLPSAVTSLRHVRSLLLDFAPRRTLQGIVTGLEPLQHYTRLTALHLDVTGVFCKKNPTRALRKTQKALDTALEAVASRPTPLTSFAVYCYSAPCTSPPKFLRPTADVLRRLCSSVQQLSLTTNELMLMVWGSDQPADSSSEAVWKAQSVRSLVFPIGFRLGYLGSARAMATVAAALPALTHIDMSRERVAVDVSALLQLVCDRLAFLRCSMCQLTGFSSVAAACTALKSLCIIVDSRLTEDEIGGAFASLNNCSSLQELSVIARRGVLFPFRTLCLASLPQLTYLHLHSDQVLRDDVAQQLCSTLLTPNLRHLALVLAWWQAVSLVHTIDSQRLAQLTHVHLICIGPLQLKDSDRWSEGRDALRAKLGAAWCQKEDDVVRWRADRLWKRSVGLPDEGEEYK